MKTIRNIIQTMGQLSDIVYNDNEQNINYFVQGYEFTTNGTSYKVIKHTDNTTASGFNALLLKNVSTGKYVIAFRGTELSSPADILAGTVNFNPQYIPALQFVQDILNDTTLKEDGSKISKSDITLTGHSLGGILTQQVGATLKIQGYAYNPWGSDVLSTLTPTTIESKLLQYLQSVISGVDLPTADFEFAKNNIYNISYQDSGTINGDPLSNLATGMISNHLGKFIPIWGEEVGVA